MGRTVTGVTLWSISVRRVMLPSTEIVGRVAQFPDGLVQSADGVMDRADRAMISDEPQRDVQFQPRRE